MRTRLTRTDWLECGLSTLMASGASALKAEPMAKALNVSRGSFYWHFPDIDAFRSGVLACWHERTTTQTIDALETHATASERLSNLLAQAFAADPALERAVRGWALHDAAAASTVARVDNERIAYVERLLVAQDFSDAQPRAALLYWAYIGRLMTIHGDGPTSARDISPDKILSLILRP